MVTRLAITIQQELQIEINGIYFHTDSITVMRWINSSRCRFHTYVGNRIAEIHDSTTPNQWRQVPGIMNRADHASRGLFPHELHAYHLFLRGRPFLRLPMDSWPRCPEEVIGPIDSSDPELKNVPWVGLIRPIEDQIDGLINRISRENRLVRAMAYVLRFINNVRTKQKTAFPDEFEALRRQ